MTLPFDLLTPSSQRILALTLLHFLWQGALIGFLLLPPTPCGRDSPPG